MCVQSTGADWIAASAVTAYAMQLEVSVAALRLQVVGIQH